MYGSEPSEQKRFQADQGIAELMLEERVADQMNVILNILPTFNMDLN
jgi:hypothetical protein